MGALFQKLSFARRACLSVLLIWAGLAMPLWAQDASQASQSTEQSTSDDTKQVADAGDIVAAPVKNKLIATPEPNITVSVEGDALPDTKIVRNQDNMVLVDAGPILTHLNDPFEYDAEKGALIVRRSQDGVVMELYTADGLVKSNGKDIGKLRLYGYVDEDNVLLTPNAIAVLSGARPKHNKETGVLEFELDPRLKVASGYQLYVNDVQLINVEPAAKSVGPVLLLPLIPITKELGSFVDVSPDRTTITVRRAQDSAEFELNLSTGLVRQAGRPIGLSKDVTYIDQVNLLLPVSTIEVLTGTNITVEPGSDRVDIILDERLTGAVEPDARVLDEARAEPFTVETLAFNTGFDTLNEARVDFRYRTINGQLRYEIPDFPTSGAEMEPSWGSLKYRHINGVTGELGDYAADNRELEGVGMRRIRGISAQKITDLGRWSLVAGAPVNGSRRISEDQTRLTFGGAAAGVRYQHKTGWEAGLSYASSDISDDQRLVLSAISGKIGQRKGEKLSWAARGAVGYFDGEARTQYMDVRAAGSARYSLSENIDIDVDASYEGAEFLRSTLERESLEEEIIADTDPDADEIDPLSAPDGRLEGSDSATFGFGLQASARRDIGIFGNPGFAARYNFSRNGVSKGREQGSDVTSFALTGSTSIKPLETYVTASYTEYELKFAQTPENDISGSALVVQGYRDFENFTVRGQYQRIDRSDQIASEFANISTSLRAKSFGFKKDSSLTIGPTVSATWTPDSSTLRGGVVAGMDSGELFGPKNRVTANLGVLQAVGSQGEQKTDTYFNVNYARRLQINDNLSLSVGYRTNLNGEQRVGLTLSGRYNYNEKRKYTKTEDGRGVLKGRIFFDENRDGIFNENERGLGGVILSVRGGNRNLALRSDRDGYYTIQNIKEGIKTATVDNRSLPLGYSMPGESFMRATIRDGHITTLDIPVVQRGQIRGFVYIDENASGSYDSGEARLEGARLKLVSTEDGSVIKETMASTYGQYAFDDLAAGSYEISVIKTNSDKSEPAAPITVELEPSKELMLKQPIATAALETKPPIIVAENSADPPDKSGEGADKLIATP